MRPTPGSVYGYLATPAHDPPWHFDEAHCTAIVYLQNGAAGGDFEIAPWCAGQPQAVEPLR